MPASYVTVPKDLSKIKSKFILGLTGSQVIHILIGGAIGVPMFFLTRGALGNGPAMLILFACVAPFAFLALYEKDGHPAIRWIYIVLRHKIYPQRRLYKTQNFYSKVNRIARREKLSEKQKTNTNGTKGKVGKKRQGSKGKQKRPKKD